MIIRTNKFFFTTVFIWTAVIGMFIFIDIKRSHRESHTLLLNTAKANFNKDAALRMWASAHGGVYVPIDNYTTPNPGLSHLEKRDIVSNFNDSLTLLNPAYMIRQINELFAEHYGITGHITSTKLIREENQPDEWEQRALQLFENGVGEVIERVEFNNEEHLRLMQPFITKASCLKCHAHQGYKVGDIRGGISVSVPVNPIDKIISKQRQRNIYYLLVLWGLGVAGIYLAYKRILSSLKQREMAKEALKEQNKKLEEALIKADESDKLKTEFIRNISHEMKTPMNGIMGFSKLLQMNKETDSANIEYCRDIQKCSTQLQGFVEDILKISLLDSAGKEITYSLFNLNSVMQILQKKYSHKAIAKNIELKISVENEADSASICSNINCLTEALSRIVDNAIKYTNEGFVEVTFKKENGEALFQITDTGIGIGPDYKDKLFDRFTQEDKELSREYDGLGLGLSIAKQNIELINGSIHVESQKGKGSSFHVAIPDNDKC